MPSLKLIRKRISSVRSTQQITKAMKMVSAAQLRRAQEAVVAARPYGAKLTELLTRIAPSAGEGHPWLLPREGSRTHVLLVTADRGLCGPYNATLIRRTEELLRQRADGGITLSIVGRKGVDYFRRRKVEVLDRWVQIPGATVELAREIGAKLAARFVSGEVDRVEVLYMRFRSALSQVPTVETLLPATVEKTAAEATEPDYIVEPGPAALLDRLLPQVLETQIHHALLEAAASEHGARMTAMESATSNASEMIFKLTLEMNRARQATITTELMEIVSGAEALKG